VHGILSTVADKDLPVHLFSKDRVVDGPGDKLPEKLTLTAKLDSGEHFLPTSYDPNGLAFLRQLRATASGILERVRFRGLEKVMERVLSAMREQLVRYQYQTPFCRFVIRLEDGGWIHVDAPGQLDRFDDEKAAVHPLPGAAGCGSPTARLRPWSLRTRR
jgi:hypothetical protein